MDMERERSERVKARWSILRHALLGSSSSCISSSQCTKHDTKRNNDEYGVGADNGAINEHSMNMFPGFGVLERNIIDFTSADRDASNANSYFGNDDDRCGWRLIQNRFTCRGEQKVITFRTREASSGRCNPSTIQERMDALLSHRKYGVDNTGNVRVWDAESTLAGFLLSAIFDHVQEFTSFLDDDHIAEERKDTAEFQDIDGVVALSLAELMQDLRAIILSSPVEREDLQDATCCVLELGAGQAGLAGLALAAAVDSGLDAHGGCKFKRMRVVLTDGHPNCVENNRICSNFLCGNGNQRDNQTKGIVDDNFTDSDHTIKDDIPVKLASRLLLWDSGTKGIETCHQITNMIQNPSTSLANNDIGTTHTPSHVGCSPKVMYNLCIASDCVHFQEFHDDLFTTIARTLTVNGIALLCQPKRGSSLRNFMALIRSVNNGNHANKNGIGHDIDNGSQTSLFPLLENTPQPPLFQMTLLEHFHSKVSKIHASLTMSQLKQKSKDASVIDGKTSSPSSSMHYDPNRHRPLLLVLKKIRPYDEEVDGAMARQHVQTRTK